jgi:hypothetical protein
MKECAKRLVSARCEIPEMGSMQGVDFVGVRGVRAFVFCSAWKAFTTDDTGLTEIGKTDCGGSVGRASWGAAVLRPYKDALNL